MRVVSLLPSATEILHAIGAGPDVVGVTFECDAPATARETARVVSTSALPENLTPAQIDAAVRARLHAGEDLYHLDRSALRTLAADVVVTQDLCAVCAVDVSEVNDALDYLGCTATVVTTDPGRLEEVWASVEQIGAVTGHTEAAGRLADDLRRRTGATRALVAGARRVPCLVLEWTDPPFAPGHWVPEMVETAGGISVLGDTGARSAPTTWASVAAAAPEVVVVAPCGFGLPRSTELAEELLSAGHLPVGIPVWAVDANASFARPGPRLVDGIQALACVLHPSLAGAPDPTMATRLR